VYRIDLIVLFVQQVTQLYNMCRLVVPR